MSEPPAPKPASASADAAQELALQHVRDALRGLQFGLISIVVQDGRVVQIERTEKRRLRRPEAE